MKALPHAGKRHGETVCCAGVTATGEWRRQYPVPFRKLRDQFARWDWIEYAWSPPGGEDRRIESQRVQQDSISISGKMTEAERARFLNPILVVSTSHAAAGGKSLALIRPKASRFYWKAKTEKEIAAERAGYKRAASQLSFLDKELVALNPCPYAFKFDYEDENGKSHKATCDDWETTAMFYNLSRRYGADQALKRMHQVFNESYPTKGMAFAMGTHSRFPDVWLLVGVLRLDPTKQLPLL